MKTLTREEILQIFQKVDKCLSAVSSLPVRIVLLGASALIMNHVVERGTFDIDIAPVFDAQKFMNVAEELGVPVDIVSISTTVDFAHTPVQEIFKGKKLTVLSVGLKDLIKLKLERLRKQDPSDIMALIKKGGIDFSTYREIALEAMKDFVGNPKRFKLQILYVASENFGDKETHELEKELDKLK